MKVTTHEVRSVVWCGVSRPSISARPAICPTDRPTDKHIGHEYVCPFVAHIYMRSSYVRKSVLFCTYKYIYIYIFVCVVIDRTRTSVYSSRALSLSACLSVCHVFVFAALPGVTDMIDRP